MRSAPVAILALAGLTGCEPRVLEALEDAGDADTQSQDATAMDATSQGDAGGGPIAYYSFDQGMGTIVHDDSDHGRDGNLLGGFWTDAGRFGGAIRFDQPDASMNYGIVVDPFPQPSNEWAVSFWLLVNGSDLTDITTVLSTEITFTGGWEVNIEPGDTTFGKVQFAFWIGTQYTTATCACLTLGSWTHLAAVVAGTPLAIQLFHDGVATASFPAGGTFLPGNPYLYMGRWGGDATRRLVGVLDEVAIFDRALSPGEISGLYAGVVP